MKETKATKQEGAAEIDFTRQKDWFDPTESQHRVTVVGCGGIGSPTAVFLSKLGIPYLTLIDDDIIEAHNVPNQFYPLKQVGKPKVVVLKAMCDLLGSSEIQAFQKKAQEVPDFITGTVVTGLDSMKAREEVWQIVKNKPGVEWLVDGRIAGQEIVIWTVNTKDPNQADDYEELALFTDEEGIEAPCTARAVIDVMALVAGLMTHQVRTIATGGEPQRLITLSVDTLTLQNWYKQQDTGGQLMSDVTSLTPSTLIQEQDNTTLANLIS